MGLQMSDTEIVIIGAGMHRFGRFPDETYGEIGRHAVREALKDAGLGWSSIEAAYCSTMYLPATAGARIMRPLGATGIPICDVEAACASGGVAMKQAIQGLKAGEYETALVLGVEKMPRGFMDPLMLYERWQVEMGMSTNPSYWAMRARRHMHEFGTTDLHIAKVAHKSHRNSVNNPYAMYRKEFSLEEIQNSQLVCDPIRLLEICAPNEGAAAVILATREKAKKLASRKPVTVAACTHTLTLYSADFRVPLDSVSATKTNPGPTERTSALAYEKAGIGPKDISLFEVQDTDAFCEIEIYEQLGLCPEGDAGKLIDEGITEIDGRYPVNVSGGLVCKGEPVGASHLGQVVELVWQLRHEAEKRQVPNAQVGLAHVLGAGGNCAVTILKA
ncbi:thiolase family protein [Rhodoferax sp.]|uniref:thiolase family protein n=1 Tax=Rhodoferax sp. TaxID=50421 RepID=UPI00262DE779|nr:thiolase family protein [Rhodoferax sp.]